MSKALWLAADNLSLLLTWVRVEELADQFDGDDLAVGEEQDHGGEAGAGGVPGGGMMTEDEWLDTCADNPEDDLTLRQAFADWLEERGDADRAQFIRLWVEIVRVAQRRTCPNGQVKNLKDRTEKILRRHRLAWLGSLVSLAPASKWLFSGGLPEALNLSCQRPPSRALKAEGIVRLAANFHLARVTQLNLESNQIPDKGLITLAASPYIRRLRSLDLAKNMFGDAGVTALAAARIPHLTRLILRKNQISVAGVHALAVLRSARLTALDLSWNQIGDAGAHCLAASPAFSRLTALHLGSNHIGDAGARALAASPHLARVSNLFLWNNPIGDVGRAALRLAFGHRVNLEPR